MLSAVAIPKYNNLKANAELANIEKVIYDIQGSVPGTFINLVELEGEDPSTIKLDQLIDVKGKNWSFSESGNRYNYEYKGLTKAHIMFHPTSKLLVSSIYCNNFPDDQVKEKCKNKYPVDDLNIYTQKLYF